MLGFKAKLIIATAIAAVLPVGAYFGYEYSRGYQELTQSANEMLEEATSRGVQKLDDWMSLNKASLKTLASTPKLAELDPEAMRPYLKNANQSISWVRTVFFADDTGMMKARSTEEALFDVKERDFFKLAKLGEFGSELRVAKATNKPALIIANSVKKGDGFGGIVAYAVDVAPVSKEIVSNKIGETGYKFILNEDGKLLAHFNADLAGSMSGQLLDFSEHPLWNKRDDKDTAFARYEYEGKEWLGSIKRSKSGYYVVSQITTGEVFKEMGAKQELAGIAMVAALLVAVGAALMMAKSVGKPVGKLADIAEEISKGRFMDEELEAIQRKDEIGDLSESLKRLSASVKIAQSAIKAKG